MNHLRFVTLFLFCLAAALLPGRAGDFHFRHYTNKNGLSHNTVYCSLQDKRGFMWFGTDDGLNRFDGYAFKVYRHHSYQPYSLLHNRIVSLFEDSEERLWVCTEGGVCFYDYKTDRFHPFSLYPGKETPEQFQFVTEDRRKNLWFTAYDRIVRYGLSDGSTTAYPAEKYFHPTAVALTSEGMPLFADSHHLYAVRPSDEAPFRRVPLLTPEEIKAGSSITALCPIPETGVLVGTDHAGLKFYRYADDGIGGEKARTVSLIPDIQVRDIAAYTQHTYWIASESGIYIYDLRDGTIRHLEKSLTNEYGLSDNAIYSLTRDREGGMWVCAFFGGISYLPNAYARFHYFIGGKTHPDMLGNAVREIVPDDYGHLWLGTEDNGINRYDPATGRMVNFSLNNPQHPLSATNIHGLMADGSRLWIGTFNKGIEVLDIPSGRVIRRYNRQNTEETLPSNFILCFYQTRKKEFLVGTSEGMVTFDPAGESFRSWPEFHALVRQIYEDGEGNLWMATNQGVYLRPAGGDTLRHFTADPQRSQSLGSNNTTSVFEDSRGRIWVTTANGLSLYNRQTGAFNRITAENGFPSNIIYRILEDKNGYFWISTANGMVRFHPDTYVMRIYTYKDGLPETQFNYCSSYQALDGTLYMGTINGMIAFSPDEIKDDPYAPPVYITGTPGSLFVTDTTWLKLPYQASTFTLSYVALSYTAPDAIQYAYRLEDSDDDWVYMKGNREVAFANLAPGKYVFKVKSTNSSGVWQGNERRLHIWITPPFWATGWAIGLYVAVLFSLIFLFYSYKKRKLEEQHRVRQAIFEARKEKEVYDAKFQFFTFITHEIRTPLTLIRGPLEKILKSGDGTPATRENLRLIEKNTERLLELSNQLLDFRKIESHGFALHFIRTDIPLWLESVLQPFRPEGEKQGKTFTAELPAVRFQAAIDREAFTKIVGNLLTNAFKYSEKFVSLQLLPPEAGERRFSILVRNDGPLIPAGQRDAIFTPFYRLDSTMHQPGSGIGLSLARSLAEFHHGTLSYQPDEEGMNRFICTLPLEQGGGEPATKAPALPESVSSVDSEQASGSLESIPPGPASTGAVSSGLVSSGSTAPGANSPDSALAGSASSDPVLPGSIPVGSPPAGSVPKKQKAPVVPERPAVLIVEDQPDMRRFIAGELSSEYRIWEAGNGQEALKVLEEIPVRLIVSDLMMPVMDGFELCNRLKNDVNYSHIPFILLTAQDTLQARLEGLNQGADAYMEKPFSIDLLFAQIRNLLKNRELLTRTYREKPTAPVASLALSPLDDLFLKKLNDFLDEQIGNEALTVEMLAAAMQMSASSLYRKVKGLSGVSPVDFIKIARLKKAVGLMQAGETRINEISYRAGFSSPAYFSTCFQKQYGKSPSEFLKDNHYFT